MAIGATKGFYGGSSFGHKLMGAPCRFGPEMPIGTPCAVGVADDATMTLVGNYSFSKAHKTKRSMRARWARCNGGRI